MDRVVRESLASLGHGNPEENRLFWEYDSLLNRSRKATDPEEKKALRREAIRRKKQWRAVLHGEKQP